MDNVQDANLTWLEDFRAGSRDAFGWWYTSWSQAIYYYARKLCEEDELAKDLTALAFVSLWEYRASLQDVNHLRNFLFRMTRIHFLQHLQKTKTAQEAECELARRSVQVEENSGEFIEAVFVKIEEAIRKLPPQQKLVIEMLFFKEIDVKTIAQLLDISEQTVRNHKTAALNFLRTELRGEKNIFLE